MAEAFKELLWDLVRTRFKTQDALAAALDMDPGHLNRAMSARGEYTFSLENCLRLAAVAHLSPGTVLRAANKQAIDALLQRLYGRPRLSADDETLLALFHRIDDAAVRRRWLRNLRQLVETLGPPEPSPPRRRRPARKR